MTHRKTEDGRPHELLAAAAAGAILLDSSLPKKLSTGTYLVHTAKYKAVGTRRYVGTCKYFQVALAELRRVKERNLPYFFLMAYAYKTAQGGGKGGRGVETATTTHSP